MNTGRKNDKSRGSYRMKQSQSQSQCIVHELYCVYAFYVNKISQSSTTLSPGFLITSLLPFPVFFASLLNPFSYM